MYNLCIAQCMSFEEVSKMPWNALFLALVRLIPRASLLVGCQGSHPWAYSNTVGCLYISCIRLDRLLSKMVARGIKQTSVLSFTSLAEMLKNAFLSCLSVVKSNMFVLESSEKNWACCHVNGDCVQENWWLFVDNFFLFMAAQIWLLAVLRVWHKLLKL